MRMVYTLVVDLRDGDGDSRDDDQRLANAIKAAAEHYGPVIDLKARITVPGPMAVTTAPAERTCPTCQRDLREAV